MEQIADATISSLQSHIRDLEQQLIETKRVVNSLRIRKGEAPIYLNSELAQSDLGGSIVIKTDQYYGQKIHSAMRQYLGQRKAANMGPATLNEIYKALCDGGLAFETESEDNRKTNMRFLLRKNTSIFHRLPDKTHFGLSEWYPGAKQEDDGGVKKSQKKSRRAKAKSARPEKAGEDTKPAPAKAKSATKSDSEEKTSLTQEQAVRAALKAMAGEFTRQALINWIEENHPAVNAAQKRQSIFAMLGKLKDEIVAVKKGKGAEPSTYKWVQPD